MYLHICPTCYGNSQHRASMEVTTEGHQQRGVCGAPSAEADVDGRVRERVHLLGDSHT